MWRFGYKHRLWEVFGSSAAIFMLEMMRMKNYWKMSDFSLFAVPYAYVDHSSYLADQLFVQNKITMKFKGEMVKDGSAYCIVFCKVLKRDVARFEEALERLKDKMLLLGQHQVLRRRSHPGDPGAEAGCRNSRGNTNLESGDRQGCRFSAG